MRDQRQVVENVAAAHYKWEITWRQVAGEVEMRLKPKRTLVIL